MTVGEAIKAEPIFSEVESILEFGSDSGDTYKTVRPSCYYGVDWEPKWVPEDSTNGCTVERADVRKWQPALHREFDLVICDAHGSVDDPEIRETTEAQIERARLMVGTLGLIAVDDCWLVDIGRTALKMLGQPSHITVERPGLWIWIAK